MAYRLYLVFAPTVGFMLIFILVLLVRYRREPAGRALFRYAALSLWLLLANVIELVSKSPETTLLFAKLGYFGLLLLPITFAGFCLRYTGHEKFVPYSVRIVFVLIAAIIFGFVLTNEYHYLFWRSVEFVDIEGLLAIRTRFGVMFWFTAVYGWAIMAASTVFVLRAYSLKLGIHRIRSIAVLIGVLSPGIFNAIYVLRIIPDLRKDYTPIGFGLSAIAFFFGAFMVRALRLVPTARGVVLEELDDGFLVVDSMGRLADYNLYAAKVLQLPDKSLGKVYLDIPELLELQDCLRDCFRQVEKLGSEFTASLNCSLQVAERTWQVKARAIFGSSAFRGIALSMTEITERLQLQDRLEAARLDVLKRERFALIGRLAANIAHEINNPLGYVWSEVRSLAAIARGKEAIPLRSGGEGQSDEISEIMGSVEDGLGRIRTVVQSLLDYSRRGAVPNSLPAAYDLNRGVRMALDLARSESTRIMDLKLELGELPKIKVIGNEIDQVLLNIIRNASDAIREKFELADDAGPPITADPVIGKPGLICIRTGSDNGMVYCEIENNGMLLADDIAESIFLPFFSTKLNGLGTGLGLSISKEIVEQHHGGRLVLIGRDPVCFRIELPLDPA